MRIQISGADLARIRSDFARFSERRFESAVAEAINGVAFAVRRAWVQDLTASLERPTPLTRRAPRVDTADVGRLTAVVYIDPTVPGSGIPPEEYVGTQERGAPDRSLKKFERALQQSGRMPQGWKVVPAKHARRDAYGNLSRGQIVQMLNQLAADTASPGYRQVIGRTQAKRAKAAARAGRQYVALLEQDGPLEPGVYMRDGRQLLMVVQYVPRTVYRRRLKLGQEADRIVAAELTPRLDRALSRRLATLEARR